MAPGRVRNTISLADSWACSTGWTSCRRPPVDLDLLETVHTRRLHRRRHAAASRTRRTGWARPTTRSSPACTRSRPPWPWPPSRRPARSGRARRSGPATSAAGCTTRCPSRTSGFCVYNDVAVAIRWLLDHGCERVGYVDVDVHHGDGVQAIFYDDPRVMTISLHETPVVPVPGHRLPARDRRTAMPRDARSTSPCRPAPATPAGCAPSTPIVPEVLRALRPQVLVTQHGCDSHRHDPLADLDLSVDGQRASYLALADLADELCEGRWVSTGGGGYAVIHVVPRAWTHLLGIVSGEPVDRSTADAGGMAGRGGAGCADHDDRWRRRAFVPFEDGFSPESRLDQAILATRRAVFPELGLDPELYASARCERLSTRCRNIRCPSSLDYHYSHTSTRRRRRGSRRDEVQEWVHRT